MCILNNWVNLRLTLTYAVFDGIHWKSCVLCNNEAAGRNLTPSFIYYYVMCNSPTGATERLAGCPGPARQRNWAKRWCWGHCYVSLGPLCKGQCVGPLEATCLSLLRETLLTPLILQGRTYQFCGSDCVKITKYVCWNIRSVCFWQNVVLAVQIPKNLCHLMAGINQGLTCTHWLIIIKWKLLELRA